MHEALKGVGVTPVTPFMDDLVTLDLTGLQANPEFLGSARVTLVYPCGNTGEFTSLSLDEWTAVVETSVVASTKGQRSRQGSVTAWLRPPRCLGGSGTWARPERC